MLPGVHHLAMVVIICLVLFHDNEELSLLMQRRITFELSHFCDIVCQICRLPDLSPPHYQGLINQHVKTPNI